MFVFHTFTPVPWGARPQDGPHAGYTAGTPWLARHPNCDQINAERPQTDADSVVHHVSGLPTFELRPYRVRVDLVNSA